MPIDEDETPIAPKATVHHPSLSHELDAKARLLYQHVGRFVFSSYEHWEFSLCCEKHPELEISVWTRIALALSRYSRVHGFTLAADDQVKPFIAALIALSFGADPIQGPNPINPTQAKELERYYLNPLSK